MERKRKIRESLEKNVRLNNCDDPGPKTKARYWSCRNW
jgi:hypothetical protein